jgi:exosortase
LSTKSYSPHQWTRWHPVALAVLMALGVLVTYDAWRDIWHRAWVDEESSHIWLVLVIAPWLLWRRRGRLRRCAPGGLLLGPITIALGSVLYFYGAIRPMEVPWHLGAVVVLVGCVISVLGKDVLVQFAPAFAVLIFLIPFPGRVRQQMAIPLEGIAARATHICCEILGMAVQRAGNDLEINGTKVAIEEGCNGLRMMFTLTLVSYAIAFSSPLKNYIRLGMVVASPVLAIIFNVLRLIPTVWLYGNASLPTANGFHDIAGWLMPPAAFLVLLGILRLLRWAMVPVSRFTLAYE